MKKTATPTQACAQKKLFRATAGLTVNQQMQVASQLQAQGDDVLKTIRQMKKTSKTQKQATKASNLKFDWLQERSHLRKLEESCSKELESLLLRMYNEASTSREAKTSQGTRTPRKKGLGTPRPPQIERSIDESDDNQEEDNHEDVRSQSISTFAQEVEQLISTEQLHRVALLHQISSEREQRAALKQLLDAVSLESNQSPTNDMAINVRDLIFDAVIGQQMIEVTLEEQMQACDQDFQSCYRAVLSSLREDRSVGPTYTDRNALQSLEAQEQQIAAMVDAVGGAECPDEMLRLEVTASFRDLYTELRADLAQYEREFVSAASAEDAAGSRVAAIAKGGGWCEADEERFVKVLRGFERKQGTGRNPQLLYDQLMAVVPAVSLKEVTKHVKFHQHLRFHKQKSKDRQREFQRRTQELQTEAREKIRVAVEQEQEKEQKLQQWQTQQQQCQQLQGQVAKWRVTKEAKERIEEQQREIERMMEEQAKQEEELRWQRKLVQQRLVVEDYKKDKVLGRMAGEKVLAEEEQKTEAERAVQSVVNAERVEYRHNELQRRVEELKQIEWHKAQVEQQRLAKLNALKADTPYAQIIANIAPDPERTRQETAAFRANVEAAQAGLPLNETGLFPSHGYDCQTLFKNARFKLGLALRNAGLNSSDYARQALANVKVCNVGAYRHHVAESTQLW